MVKKINSFRSLFNVPIAYGSKPIRKTRLLVLESDDSGNSLVVSRCVEDEMANQIDLNFSDVSLSNLVSKGVEPHSLDMIDSSRLGVDEGVDRLAQHLIDNTDKYVQSFKSE